MDISKRLRTLRVDSGMSQQDVADHLNVTRVSVGKWESGVSMPRPKKLEELASLFGTSVSYLLGEDGPERVEARASSAMVPLKVIGLTCMGDGEEQEADAVVEVPEGVASRHPGLFVVHGIGECMDRRFPEDAALGVDPAMEPRTGDAVLVRDEAHGSFVHVYMAGSGGTVMLSADSWQEGYEDVVVGPQDPPIEVLGTVVWWQAYEDVRR